MSDDGAVIATMEWLLDEVEAIQELEGFASTNQSGLLNQSEVESSSPKMQEFIITGSRTTTNVSPILRYKKEYENDTYSISENAITRLEDKINELDDLELEARKGARTAHYCRASIDLYNWFRRPRSAPPSMVINALRMSYRMSSLDDELSTGKTDKRKVEYNELCYKECDADDDDEWTDIDTDVNDDDIYHDEGFVPFIGSLPPTTDLKFRMRNLRILSPIIEEMSSEQCSASSGSSVTDDESPAQSLIAEDPNSGDGSYVTVETDLNIAKSELGGAGDTPVVITKNLAGLVV